MKQLMLAFLFAFSTQAAAECTRPVAPELPDGETSDLQAMVEGQKAVKTYVAATEAYLDCLGQEETSAGEEETEEAKVARVEEHNAAVDEMEQVAAEFNEEIREYKAKSQ